MNKFASLGALATLTAAALPPTAAHAAPATVAEGTMIYGANGQILAPVYRVNVDGSVALIVEGRLLTLAPAALSDVNGKLTWPRTTGELLR